MSARSLSVAQDGVFTTPIRVAARIQLSALAPTMPVAEAFSLLALSTAAEAAWRASSLRSSDDPETLHKLRVALRRLRTLWWTYRPLLDGTGATAHAHEFKSLASIAGVTRNWDVLRHLMQEAHAMWPRFATLLADIDEKRAEALLLSRATIFDAQIESSLKHAIDNTRHHLDARSGNPALANFVEGRIERAEKALKKAVKRAIQDRASRYTSLHEVRIAGKKLRYVLEFFSPILQRDHQAVIESLASVQDVLGMLNDLVTSEALLREHTFQLTESAVVNDAIGYLEGEKMRQMRTAGTILQDVPRTMTANW